MRCGDVGLYPKLYPLSMGIRVIQYKEWVATNGKSSPDLRRQVAEYDSIADRPAATVNRRVAGSNPA